MDIVLYGAGKRGKKIEALFYRKGIVIKGFADSKKSGCVNCENGRSYPILELPEILRGGV